MQKEELSLARRHAPALDRERIDSLRSAVLRFAGVTGGKVLTRHNKMVVEYRDGSGLVVFWADPVLTVNDDSAAPSPPNAVKIIEAHLAYWFAFAFLFTWVVLIWVVWLRGACQ